MTIQWTLIAGVMYVELVVTIVFLLPFISPQRWHSFFKSRFLRSIHNMANFYFKAFLFVLFLFFADAIREMRKYNLELSEQQGMTKEHHLDVEMQAHMRLFRAQRNFYISGFSLFLWLVLQRLMTLLSRLAVSIADGEAALKQARSASQTAALMMQQEKRDDDNKQQDKVNAANELKELKEENKKLRAENDASLKQAEAVSREYDRLMEEHSKLQRQLQMVEGTTESKKDS